MGCEAKGRRGLEEEVGGLGDGVVVGSFCAVAGLGGKGWDRDDRGAS